MYRVASTSRIAERLRAARVRSNLRLHEIASLFGGLSPSRVSEWERGIRLPLPSRWNKLARVYRVGVEDLFLELDTPDPRSTAGKMAAADGAGAPPPPPPNE